MTISLSRRNQAIAEKEPFWRQQFNVPLRTKTMLLLVLLPCTVALRLLLHIATDDAVNTTTRSAVQTEEQITQEATVLRFIEVEMPKQLSNAERYKTIYRQNKSRNNNKDTERSENNVKQADDDSNIIESNDSCQGKEEFLPILQNALAHLIDDCPSSRDMQAAKQTLKGVSDIFGITTCNVRDLCPQLGKDATWEQVVEQYYFKQRKVTEDNQEKDQQEQPKHVNIQVIGTRTCSDFRQGLLPQTPEGHVLQPAVRVAGLFHSGLDVMAATLHANHLLHDDIEDDKFWQVPWGKHTPVQFSTSQIYKDHGWKSILPVVVVRDPFRWLTSLCNSRDGNVPWMGGKPLKCPSLVLPATKTQEESTTNSTSSGTQPNKIGIYWHPEEYPDAVPEEYDSLGNLWTDWYNEYLLADFPRLLVRYEDLLFFPDQVMKAIAECIGTEITQPTRTMLHTDADNGSEGTADLIRALAKHGTTKGRTDRLSRQDLEYAQITMADLMDWFGYQTIVD